MVEMLKVKQPICGLLSPNCGRLVTKYLYWVLSSLLKSVDILPEEVGGARLPPRYAHIFEYFRFKNSKYDRYLSFFFLFVRTLLTMP